MMLDLPKKSDCKPSDVDNIKKKLMSVVAYQPSAKTTYQFYEEIDEWLGPWGENGYPIGYGKKYNIAFTLDTYLNSYDHPVSKSWVNKTTVNLQVSIIDYIVSRVKNGTLASIDETSLRAAAFASHPKSYLDAGLRDVAREEVGAIIRIFMIPYAEFNPSNPSFKATINQVIDVISEPGILAWITDLSLGVIKWPIKELENKFGLFWSFLDWEIKRLYGFPGFFY